MKTHIDTALQEVHGALESTKVTIETNAKAIKELISGIYSNKSYAIARETMANCHDSHTQADTDRPFEIQTPTVLNPEYVIRDYGVSMTHEMVMGLYSTLFKSTKDDPNSADSNKYVGKFGLGSKSPFSYTDAMQLTAYLDGEMRTYEIYLNGGELTVDLFVRQATKEADGIRISFPVDPKDCADFERAIVRSTEAYQILEQVPTFIGKQPDLIQRVVMDQGKNWRRVNNTSSGSAEALQGTVLYPLNFHSVVNCPPELKVLFDLPMQIFFDIGELDVITSREGLSYDESTSKNIIKVLHEVQVEMRNRAASSLKRATTFHEFNFKMAQIRKSMDSSLWDFLRISELKYGDKATTAFYSIKTRDLLIHHAPKSPVVENDTSEDGVEDVVQRSKALGLVERHHRFGDLHFCDLTNKLHKVYYDSTIPRFKALPTEFALRSDRSVMYVILEDMTIRPRYTRNRLEIMRSSKTFNDKSVVLWAQHSGDPTMALKRLRAAMGRIPIFVYHLKDIPYVPERFSRNVDGTINSPYRTTSGNGWTNPGVDDLPEEAYYVNLNRENIVGTGYGMGSYTLNDIRKRLISWGQPDMPVIGIPKSHQKIIKDNPQWVEFLPLAEKKYLNELKEHYADLVDLNVANMYSTPITWASLTRIRNLFGDLLFHKVSEGTSISELMSKYDECIDRIQEFKDRKVEDTVEILINDLELMGNTDNELKLKAVSEAEVVLQEVHDAANQVKKDYPLIKYLSIPDLKAQHGPIHDFHAAKVRRETVAPFYAWLKNSRKECEELKSAA